MKAEMLVRMANQMEDFFKSQSHEDAVHGIEDHIRRYWDPRMRKAMAEHLASGADTGLKPLAREAAERACAPAAGGTR
jgi:formate dehydrogenase subunit delta